MYEKYEKLRKQKNVSNAEVSRQTGVDRTSFTHWKNGRYTPKAESIQKIADYFGVPLSYFYGEATEDFLEGIPADYFIEAETQQIAEEIYADKDMKLLFKVARDISKEDLELLLDMARRLKGDD